MTPTEIRERINEIEDLIKYSVKHMNSENVEEMQDDLVDLQKMLDGQIKADMAKAFEEGITTIGQYAKVLKGMKTPLQILKDAYKFKQDSEVGYLLGADDIVMSLTMTGMAEAEAVAYFNSNYGKDV